MPAIDKITVDVVAKVKCTHTVLYAASSFYMDNLKSACARAETSGMCLMSVVEAGHGYVVLVFIGDEEVSGEEEKADEPS